MLVILTPNRQLAQQWLADQGARGARVIFIYDYHSLIHSVRGTRFSTIVVLGRPSLPAELHYELINRQHFILFPHTKDF